MSVIRHSGARPGPDPGFAGMKNGIDVLHWGMSLLEIAVPFIELPP
jgi:hypothetical protein